MLDPPEPENRQKEKRDCQSFGKGGIEGVLPVTGTFSQISLLLQGLFTTELHRDYKTLSFPREAKGKTLISTQSTKANTTRLMSTPLADTLSEQVDNSP